MQLHPKTEKPVRYFERDKKRKCVHLQPHERIRWIPGSEEAVELVRRIFRQYYIEGCSPYVIARDLNDRGDPPAYRDRWSAVVIQEIVCNTSYLGFGYACQYEQGVNSCRGKDHPVQYETPRRPGYRLDGKGRRKRVPRRRRPFTDWVRVDYPTLKNFLHRDLRLIAYRAFNSRIARFERGVGVKVPVLRRPLVDSPYVLTGLLRQGNHRMVGYTGPASARYYQLSSAINHPKTGDIQRKKVRAEIIEGVVLGEIKKIFEQPVVLKQKILEAVKHCQAKQPSAQRYLNKLIKEKSAIWASLLLQQI